MKKINATTRHSEEAKRPKNPNKSSLRDSTQRVESWQSTKTNPALDIFYKICEIPHPSSHTKDLQKFLVDFLKQCDCKVESDSAGNIHALKGAPKLIFQAHYDMVLVGQKVAPFVENGFLKSRNSSLGADNGIAVALLLDFAQKCKNFEILLTNDEEIGMLGAKNLKLKTQSKTMINLDSECLNEICVGCAGGFDADISLADFSENLGAECLQSAEIYELSAQHFKGGHSGIDIDKNIKNAIVELLWTLESLRQKCEFSILEINGGENRNSIPINAKAIIAVKTNQSARSVNPCPTRHTEPLGEVSKSRESKINNESMPQKRINESFIFAKSKQIANNSKVAKMDSSLITFAQNDEKRAKSAPQLTLKKLKSYTPNPTQNPINSAVIPHLLRLHNGIYEKNGESITSSLNFSLISNESLKIMVRANSAEFLERHEMRLKSLFGDSVKMSGFYNAWEDSSSDSPILRALQGLYDKHQIAHKVVQIHAGLECGILKEKCALREVISIGPTIFHPHSKNEALDLDSFRKIYDILCDLMEL